MIGNLLGDPMQAVQFGSVVTADFEDYKREDHSYTLVQWRLAKT
jgi:transcription elongation GreA/GreB family factor